ncbi:MAG: thioredoxin family protein [Bacteroidales bacterium]|nr:thioredoxin family protein [Bacteroidales bacterium]
MSVLNAQGYKVGDEAEDFSLKNVDGKQVSLVDYPDAKGFVVVFTCNHCPYAQAYEQRIIDIHKIYEPKGYPVIAINPNDPEIQPGDSYEAMQQRASEKHYPFPYLFDASQEVYRKYGATRTPHVFLLNKVGGKLMVAYIGTIDDNYKDESAVTQKYLSDAIDAVIAGKTPDPSFTKAIGCSIKDKRNQ